MTLREEIVKEAKSWTDTPYHDHAGIKGCGVDCAFFPLRVYQAVGKIDANFKPPRYSPQKWLNSPEQVDKRRLKFEDRTFLEVVYRFARAEIRSICTPDPPEITVVDKAIEPGDFMIVKVASSWTHGGIVIEWPEFILHPLKERGVIGSHALTEGFWAHRQKRFFTVMEPGEI